MAVMLEYPPSYHDDLQQEDLTSQAKQAERGGWAMFHLSDDRNHIGVKFVPGNSNGQIIEVNAIKQPDNSLILAAIIRGSSSSSSVDHITPQQHEQEQEQEQEHEKEQQQQQEQPTHKILIQEEKSEGSGDANNNADIDDKKWVEEMRGWLMMAATVVLAATYQAGISPPGGMWQDDQDGHTAGTPIKRDKNPAFFQIFDISNTVAMAQSVVILFLLVKRRPFQSTYVYIHALRVLVATSLLALVTAFSACFDKALEYVYFWIFCNALLVSLLVKAASKFKGTPRPVTLKVKKFVRDKSGWIVVLISISIYVVAVLSFTMNWPFYRTCVGVAFLYIVGSAVWVCS